MVGARVCFSSLGLKAAVSLKRGLEGGTVVRLGLGRKEEMEPNGGCWECEQGRAVDQ